MSAPSFAIESVQNATSIADAFAYCEKMALGHYENFPVGSLLIPKNRRRYVYSIYAFARTADDFADEGYETGTAPEERLSLLEDWEKKLEDCVRGDGSHPVFVALAATIRDLELPLQLFKDLLSAFKQDVVKTRYENFDEVLDYCRRSANPIGRLILLLFDYRDQHLHQLSDHICTALQLANFWQDVSVDLQKNRIYLPQNDLRRFEYPEAELFRRHSDARFVELIKFQVERTRNLFEQGKLLPELVRGRLRYELRLTWHGGMRILKLIEQQGFDTLSRRPQIKTFDKLGLLIKTLVG